jgi:hypothetical protein
MRSFKTCALSEVRSLVDRYECLREELAAYIFRLEEMCSLPFIVIATKISDLIFFSFGFIFILVARLCNLVLYEMLRSIDC